MTPETLAFIGALLERYGLPIAVLVGLSWALLTRRLTLGSETTYVEARRMEEREGRLAAEKQLQENTAALSQLADAQEETADMLLNAFEEGRPRARG